MVAALRAVGELVLAGEEVRASSAVCAAVLLHVLLQQGAQLAYAGVGCIIAVGILRHAVEVIPAILERMIDQLVVVGRDGVSALLSGAELRVDLAVPRIGEEVDAVKVVTAVLNPGKAEERGRDVHERADIAAPRCGLTGDTEHERDAQRAVQHGAFAHRAEIAKHFTVIGGEEDDGVVIQPACLQRIDDTADLIVHKGDAGKVEIAEQAEILTADADLIQREPVAHERGEFRGILRHVRIVGDGAVHLVPGRRRREGRMRMDERADQKERARCVAVPEEIYAPVADPLCRVNLGGKLRNLRNVVHFAALPVVVKDVFIRAGGDELRILIRRVRHFLLRVPSLEAHGAIEIQRVVHFADAAGLIAAACKFGVEAVSGVGAPIVVVAAAGVRRIKAGVHRKPRGNADGCRRKAVVKYGRLLRQRVQRRSDQAARLAGGVDRVRALLIGK